MKQLLFINVAQIWKQLKTITIIIIIILFRRHLLLEEKHKYCNKLTCTYLTLQNNDIVVASINSSKPHFL